MKIIILVMTLAAFSFTAYAGTDSGSEGGMHGIILLADNSDHHDGDHHREARDNHRHERDHHHNHDHDHEGGGAVSA